MSSVLLVPLRGRKVIGELFRTGRRYRDTSGIVEMVVLQRTEQSSDFVTCYIVVLPRHLCSDAVGRNKIRRLMRESLRLLVQTHPELLSPYIAVGLRWLVKPSIPCKRLRLHHVMPAVQEALSIARYAQSVV